MHHGFTDSYFNSDLYSYSDAHSAGTSNKLEHYVDQARENRSTMGSVDLSRSDEQRSVPPSDEWRDLPEPTYTINANTSFRDNQPTRGVSYCYEVTAINANGESGPSNESCTQTK